MEAIELDALFWGPDWTAADKVAFRKTLSERLAACDGWVVDGNYSSYREVVAANLTAVVWLDYPVWRTQWQLVRRTFARVSGRELLWNDNRETFRGHLSEGFLLFRHSLRVQRRLRRDGVTGIPEGVPVYRVRNRAGLIAARDALRGDVRAVEKVSATRTI